MRRELTHHRYKSIYITGHYPEDNYYTAEIPMWGNSLKEIKEKIDLIISFMNKINNPLQIKDKSQEK